MSEERRRYKRLSVEGIHGSILFSSEVGIINISVGGAAIETTRRLNIGAEYTLKLEDRGRAVALKGIVVWAVLAEGKKGPRGEVVPVYRAGVEFTETLTGKSLELVEFIESHKKGLDERLSGLRFKINAPEHAVLRVPLSYNVRKLSLGGMLMESSQALTAGEMFPMEIYLNDGKVITFTGRVASCIEVPIARANVPGGSHGVYHIGIEFMDMSEACRHNLSDYISSL